MRRIIVTGATSMIGIATIEACIDKNVEVVAILRHNSAREQRIPKSDLITKVYADSFEFPNVPYELGADVLYHFMWEYSHKEGRDNPLLQEKNIALTLQTIKFAKKNGCKKIIFAGSQAEYGSCEGKIDENISPKPQTAYGIAKYSACMMAEKLCKQYGIQFVWARIFSVYGKYDNDDTMITTTIEKLLRQEKVSFSSGLQMWNFLNETDAGNIFWKLGAQDVREGIYNVANVENKPLVEYIKEILELFPKAQYEFSSSCGRRVIGIEADTQKIFNQIGNFDMVPFQEGLKQIIKYRGLK